MAKHLEGENSNLQTTCTRIMMWTASTHFHHMQAFLYQLGKSHTCVWPSGDDSLMEEQGFPTRLPSKVCSDLLNIKRKAHQGPIWTQGAGIFCPSPPWPWCEPDFQVHYVSAWLFPLAKVFVEAVDRQWGLPFQATGLFHPFSTFVFPVVLVSSDRWTWTRIDQPVPDCAATCTKVVRRVVGRQVAHWFWVHDALNFNKDGLESSFGHYLDLKNSTQLWQTLWSWWSFAWPTASLAVVPLRWRPPAILDFQQWS